MRYDDFIDRPKSFEAEPTSIRDPYVADDLPEQQDYLEAEAKAEFDSITDDSLTNYINQVAEIPMQTHQERMALARRVAQGDDQAKQEMIEKISR